MVLGCSVVLGGLYRGCMVVLKALHSAEGLTWLHGAACTRSVMWRASRDEHRRCCGESPVAQLRVGGGLPHERRWVAVSVVPAVSSVVYRRRAADTRAAYGKTETEAARNETRSDEEPSEREHVTTSRGACRSDAPKRDCGCRDT